MGKSILPILFIILSVQLSAQEKQESRIKESKIWVVSVDSQKVKGALYETKDSSISIIRNSFQDSITTSHIYYNNINTIKIRKSGRIAHGALIGFATGALVGFMVGNAKGYTPYDGSFLSVEHTGGENAMIGLRVGGLEGAILGAIIYSIRINIPIRGEKAKFDQYRNKLKKHSYMK